MSIAKADEDAITKCSTIMMIKLLKIQYVIK